MKKLYMKPELHYESFNLMDAIASCTLTATQGDPLTCTYYDESFGDTGLMLFANSKCTLPPETFEAGVNLIFGS